jgi:hypothetical protein
MGQKVVLFDLVHHREAPCTGNHMGKVRVRVPQFARTSLNGSHDFSEAITVAISRYLAPRPLAIVAMSTAMPSCSSANRLPVRPMPHYVVCNVQHAMGIANLAGALIAGSAGDQMHALGFAIFQMVLAGEAASVASEPEPRSITRPSPVHLGARSIR